MKAKKILKRIVLLTISIMTIITIVFQSRSEAAFTLTDIKKGGDTFISKGNQESEDMFDSAKEQEAIDQVYYVMLGIGLVLAFVVGIVLGIQFITSGAAGQAKVKEKLIPYVLGIFIIFGGFGIWRIAINTGKDMFQEEQINVSTPATEDKLYIVIEPYGSDIYDGMPIGSSSTTCLCYKLRFEDKLNVNLKIKSGDVTLTKDTNNIGSAYLMGQGNYSASGLHFESRNSDKVSNGDIAILTINIADAASTAGGNGHDIGISSVKVYDENGNDVSNRISYKKATVHMSFTLDGAQSTTTTPTTSPTTTTTITTTTTTTSAQQPKK